jgi:hypothetical protein
VKVANPENRARILNPLERALKTKVSCLWPAVIVHASVDAQGKLEEEAEVLQNSDLV